MVFTNSVKRVLKLLKINGHGKSHKLQNRKIKITTIINKYTFWYFLKIQRSSFSFMFSNIQSTCLFRSECKIVINYRLTNSFVYVLLIYTKKNEIL